ncbi:MAG: patatin-like phospholipase family protein [Candidatus Heimdallarchaeaceae archaeon]|jgi:NTE family protein
MGKVSKRNVEYLAFEGGGGKGIAYLGALQALEELEIISYIEEKRENQIYTRLDTKKIKGVAGTSVGSVTALLVACGYTPVEAENIITKQIGENILDTVEFGKIPTIYTKENQTCVSLDKRFGNIENYLKNSWSEYMQSDDRSIKGLLEIPLKSFSRLSLQFFAYLLRGYLNFELKRTSDDPHKEKFHLIPVHDIIQTETQITATNFILKRPIHSFNSIKHEYGLFLGESARNLFDEFIEKKSGIKNCTFKQFEKEFGIDLVIAAVCLNSGDVIYFRNKGKWKNLCVADAVRMSIGIPFLFKPVIFEEKDNDLKPFSGNLKTARFMVDGGVVNNFPIHAFDRSKSSGLNSNVLGFSLVPESKKKMTEILSLTDYMDNALYVLLKNATHLQIRTPREKEHVIELDTGEVSIFDFTFEELPIDIISSARERTIDYFN